MKVVVFANERSWEELIALAPSIEWVKAMNISSLFNAEADADAFFILEPLTEAVGKTTKPVFINSVHNTLQQMKVTDNFVRINGWNGFLKRESWEVSGKLTDAHHIVIKALQKKIVPVPDEPGFISARIIAMIINEAFFAKEDQISTENEIDIAMKLGTNYPKGPFEWAQEIGIKNIYELLLTLAKKDLRYKPAALLRKKATEQ